MDIEKIKVRVTQSGQTMDVVVYSKRTDSSRLLLAARRAGFQDLERGLECILDARFLFCHAVIGPLP